MTDFGKDRTDCTPGVTVLETRSGVSAGFVLVGLILNCAEQVASVLSLFTACCFITLEEKEPLMCSHPSLCRLML